MLRIAWNAGKLAETNPQKCLFVYRHISINRDIEWGRRKNLLDERQLTEIKSYSPTISTTIVFNFFKFILLATKLLKTENFIEHNRPMNQFFIRAIIDQNVIKEFVTEELTRRRANRAVIAESSFCDVNLERASFDYVTGKWYLELPHFRV